MTSQKISQANTESPQVAQEKVTYYEYITKDGVSVLLDHYEWARGLGITDRSVKNAQAARKREVKKGFAYTKEA